MGILEGKNILVTGVTMDTSIAYRVAEIAQAEGAKVVVSNLGRAVGLTRRVVGRLRPCWNSTSPIPNTSRRCPGSFVNTSATVWTASSTPSPSPIPSGPSVGLS